MSQPHAEVHGKDVRVHGMHVDDRDYACQFAEEEVECSVGGGDLECRSPTGPARDIPLRVIRRGTDENEEDDVISEFLFRYEPEPSSPARNVLKGILAIYRAKIVHELIAEFIGTFIITMACINAVASAVLSNAFQGLWQVGIVTGLGVAFAIYCTAPVSGAHLNPAVSVALAIFRRKDFPVWKLVPYIVAQVLGGFVAGLQNWFIFRKLIDNFELENDIVRGSAESIKSAMNFGLYFPNPGFYNDNSLVSPIDAMIVEAWGTGFLVFFILATTNHRHALQKAPTQLLSVLVPLLIGLVVAFLISVYAPLTQAAWNPARDFGPRLAAFCLGWGSVALPGPRNGFWVYWVGPILGALGGALLHDLLLRPAVRLTERKNE